VIACSAFVREVAAAIGFDRDLNHGQSVMATSVPLRVPRASLTPTLSLAEGEGDGIPLASPLVEA